MKNTTKIIIATTILLTTSISGVSAFGMGPTTTSMHSNVNEVRTKIKVERKEFKADMKKASEEKKKFIKENRETIKTNIKSFKTNTKKEFKSTFKTLSKETRIELKKDKQILQNKIKEFKAEIKANKTNFNKRNELRKQISEIRKANLVKIREKFLENPKALEVINERIKLFEKNTELRAKNLAKRIAFRGNRSDKILKYKEIFIKRLGDRINKIPTKTLVKISPKIIKFLNKIKNNKRFSTTKKDKLISELTALKEIIDEKIENAKNEIPELDIDTLLK